MNKVKWWTVDMAKPPLKNQGALLCSDPVLTYDKEMGMIFLVQYYGDDMWLDDCGHNHYPTHWTDLPSTEEINK